MTKEQYLQLKDELKALAKELTSDKQEFKQKQRNHSKVEKEQGSCITDAYESNNSTKIEQLNNSYVPMTKAQESLREKKLQYRTKHIFYSMARGKTIEQIEPVVTNTETRDYYREKVYKDAEHLCEKYSVEPLFKNKGVAA
jgi:hypothetical protein